jgi:diguanylate cyclase (GGDEF)-like protein/PAS domain S-box-containing protein
LAVDTLESVISAGELGLVLLDELGRVTLWNDWMVLRTEVSAERALGASLEDLYPDLAASPLRRAVREALDHDVATALAGSLGDSPLHLMSADELGVPSSRIVVKPIRAHDGTTCCLIQVFDATAEDRHQPVPAEQETGTVEAFNWGAESARRLRVGQIDGADAIVTVDDRGRIVLATPVAEAMFGYDLGALADREIDALLPALTADKAEGAQAPSLADAMVVAFRAGSETVACRKDGSTFPAEVSVSEVVERGRLSYVAIMRDIGRCDKPEDETGHPIGMNSLTGLCKAAIFHDRLQEAVVAGERSAHLVAVLLLDVHDFTHINDNFGKACGDALLCEVATRLADCSRESDTVARLGTDEFAIIANNLDSADDAAFLANRIIQSLQAPILVDGRQLQTGTSVGLAMFPTDETVASELLVKAELALNQAKASGRGTYRFFNANINAQIEARKSVERDLLRAVQWEELVVHYQPVHELEDDEVVGVEALLRWQHPERGLLLPDEFIHVAEATGLIVDIGEWVLRTVCAHVKSWQDAGAPPVRVSVNVSAVQLREPDFVEKVRRILEETGCDGSWLELEMTESVLAADVEVAAQTMHALHQLGIQTAIDDFGTGHSSMADLKQVPIDRLKIDRSFIRQLAEAPDDASIAAAIIGLARSLDIGVVAEGVETAEQLGLLRNQGCPEAQGFLMSRPLAGAELESFLDARLDERGRAPDADSNSAKSGSFRPRLVSSNRPT